VYYELTDRFVVSTDLQTTWRFFSSAENLPRITPPWLSFRIDTPTPVTIEADSLLDYTIRWMGLPIRWRTKIIDWSPPRQFIDLQVKGPYALWHHQHRFNEVDDGTECSDRVIYQLPVPGVRRLVHTMTVRKQLVGIFNYRREVIARELGLVRAIQQEVQIQKL
jgi:ligand-binding SRPBCC domain-containing protein